MEGGQGGLTTTPVLGVIRLGGGGTRHRPTGSQTQNGGERL